MSFPLPKSSIPQKTLLILFGIFLSFIFLEISMRLAGCLILSIQEHKNKASPSLDGSYRILCLGGSTTAGVNSSYPAQLEQILKERLGNPQISVINKGVPAITTSGILEQLEGNLDRYKPHMVVAMMGINDAWNPLQVMRSEKHSIRQRISSLRVYKLLNFILLSIKNYDQSKKSFYPQRVSDVMDPKLNSPAEELISIDDILRKLAQGKPLNKDSFLRAAEHSNNQGRFFDAELILKKAFNFYPDFHYAYSLLGRFYIERQEYDLAIKMLNKAIEISPTSEWHYILLAKAHWGKKNYTQAENILQKLLTINDESDRALGMLAQIYQEQDRVSLAEEYHLKAKALRTKYYLPQTQDNYRELWKIVRAKGIPLVCVQYPVRSIAPLKRMFDDKSGLIFVDNEKPFKEALKAGPYAEYFVDNFAGDFGHCTRKGNHLLAQNIARTIGTYLTE